MEQFYTMVSVQSVLLVYLLIGVIARKKNIITPEGRKCFIDLVINITLPSMIFNSFHEHLGMEQLRLGSLILAVSLLICTGEILLGKLLFGRYPFARRSIMQYGTLISNSGFAGLPLIDFAYGSIGVFYASIFVIPTRIFMWSAGISLFTNTDRRTRLKNVLLNPGIIAVELGILRMLLDLPLPSLVDTALASLGNATTPLSMIAVGSILADVDVRTVIDRDTCLLTFLRLVCIPGVVLAALRLLHVDPLLTAVAVLLTAMPVGSTAAILAEKYGADYVFGSKCVFLSTVLSLATAPMMALFLPAIP